MSAMPAFNPAIPRSVASTHLNLSSPDERDFEDVIESEGIRSSIESVFIDCTQRRGLNGIMALDDLFLGMKASRAAIVLTRSRLAAIIERCPRLANVPDDLVVWTGSPVRSVLLQRLRVIVAVRHSKLSSASTVYQLQRGNDRFPMLTEHSMIAIADACENVRSIDGAISRSADFTLQASDVLGEDELKIFNLLRKTTFPLSATQIHDKLHRRTNSLDAILRESPAISEVDGGFRSIIETATQLSLHMYR